MNNASLSRLQMSNFKLDMLLRITLAINENAPIEKLISDFKDILIDELNIGKVLMFSFNHRWEKVLVCGVSHMVADSIRVETDLLYYRQITNLTNTLNPNLEVFDIIIPVYHHNHPIAYVIIGDIDEEQLGMSPTIKHLYFIQTLANIIMVAIENRRLFNESVRQESMRKELELASRMQNMLIPNPFKLPNNRTAHAAAYYLPHYEVGGDYYDWIKVTQNDYYFCIADVSGKGIAAALLMSNFQANLRAQVSTNRPLNNIVNSLNELVLESTNGEKFITLFIGKYNSQSRQMEYINAGHNPPVYFDAKSNQVQQLTLGCMGVGMFDKIPKINVGQITVEPESKLICFTDGIVELEDNNHIQFGTEPIERIIKTGSIDSNIETIIENVHQYKGPDREFADDLTLFGIAFH